MNSFVLILVFPCPARLGRYCSAADGLPKDAKGAGDSRCLLVAKSPSRSLNDGTQCLL